MYDAIGLTAFGVLLMVRLMFQNTTAEIVRCLLDGLRVPYVVGDRRLFFITVPIIDRSLEI